MAVSADTMTTKAQNGGSGGTAVTPVVALSFSNATTGASVAGGPLLTLAGKLLASVKQTVTATTTAAAAATGVSAALGAGLGLTVANHSATATLGRDVTATGDVTLTSEQASSTETSATASASGAGSGTPNVDTQTAAQRSLGNSVPGSSGSGGAGTPSASTSGGPVSVAAAVAVNIANTNSSATIGLVNINAGGIFRLDATGDTDGKATADGSGVTSGAVGIGAAVAIDLATITVQAKVPNGGGVTSDTLALQAGMNSSSGDGTNRLSATSTSGAGAGTVGVAGSLALNIENLSSSALLDGNYARGPPAGLTSGDISLRATSVSDSKATATAGVTGAGLGASVGTNLVTETTRAALGAGSTIANAHDLSIEASSTSTTTTAAETGTAGGGVSVAPAVSVGVSNVTTAATVNPGPVQTLAGTLLVQATQTAGRDDDREGLELGIHGGRRRVTRADDREPRRHRNDAARAHRRRRGDDPGDGHIDYRRLRDGLGHRRRELRAERRLAGERRAEPRRLDGSRERRDGLRLDGYTVGNPRRAARSPSPRPLR